MAKRTHRSGYPLASATQRHRTEPALQVNRVSGPMIRTVWQYESAAQKRNARKRGRF